jgi:hypothetical protein
MVQTEKVDVAEKLFFEVLVEKKAFVQLLEVQQ